MLGFFQLELYIPSAFSLKEKRFVLKSIKTRSRNQFNVSIAEIGYQDKWQRSLLGIACVANEQQFIEQTIQKVLKLIEHDDQAEIIRKLVEIL